MTQKASEVADALWKIASPVWNALLYSPLETILPLSTLCISVSRGRADLVHANRAMSKYHVVSQKICNHAEDVFPTPDEAAADAALFMKEAGMSKSDAVLVIPRSWVILKSADLPAAVQNNLIEVVSYEFDRLTPLSASDALYDFFSEGVSQDRIGILLAAAKGSVLNEYVDKLAAQSVTVRRIDFDISALAGYFRFVSGLKTAIFAGVSSRGIEGGLFAEGILKYAESHEFTADDDYKKSEELEGFIAGRQKTETGAASPVPILLEFSEQASGIRSSLASRANVSFRTTIEFGEKIKGVSRSGALQNAATGGALGYLCPKTGGFNLLSKGVREGDKRSYLLTYILAAAVVICLALYLFLPMQTERDRLEEIEKQIAQRKSEVAAVEKIRGEIEAINKRAALVDGFRGNKATRIDLVRELTAIIPRTAWLTRVRISGEKINIDGYAQSATSLVQLLEVSKYFRNVEFASPTFRDQYMNMDRFQIRMELKELKKEEAVKEEASKEGAVKEKASSAVTTKGKASKAVTAKGKASKEEESDEEPDED